MQNRFATDKKDHCHHMCNLNEKGSMIVIVLMLLALMSIIGIASTNTTVTENFLVRNVSIRKQNLQLVDAVASEVFQTVNDALLIDIDDPTAYLTFEEIMPNMNPLPWVRDKDEWIGAGNLYEDWYDRGFVGRLLVGGATPNSNIPNSLILNDPTVDAGVAQLLNERGEWDFDNPDPDLSPIRYALVGWAFSEDGGDNLNLGTPGQPIVRIANILTEYVSEDFGVIRLVVGLKREFSS